MAHDKYKRENVKINDRRHTVRFSLGARNHAATEAAAVTRNMITTAQLVC